MAEKLGHPGAMHTDTLRISVICPVYNTPVDLLRTAIESVMSTTAADLHELLLVDDASTDPLTLAELDRITSADPRVSMICQPKNRGPSAARNEGCRRASGEWIAFIDSDDFWLPGRIEAMRAVLERAPDAAWIAGNYLNVDDDGSTDAAPLLSACCAAYPIDSGIVRLRSPDLTKALVSNHWLLLGASVMKKSLIETIGGFSGDRIYYSEDDVFFATASVICECYFLERPLLVYRRRPLSLMASSRRLTSAYVAGWLAARKAKLLGNFRKEIRWRIYGMYKGLAVNNLRNGNSWRALRFALLAWRTDPRETGDLLLFMRILLFVTSGQQQDTYSSAERFEAADIGVASSR